MMEKIANIHRWELVWEVGIVNAWREMDGRMVSGIMECDGECMEEWYRRNVGNAERMQAVDVEGNFD